MRTKCHEGFCADDVLNPPSLGTERVLLLRDFLANGHCLGEVHLEEILHQFISCLSRCLFQMFCLEACFYMRVVQDFLHQ